MKKFFPLLFIVFFSCNSQDKSQVALKFINDYTTDCNETINSHTDDTNWVRNNKLLTENFKNSYYSTIEQGWENEPYVGLDADPIFDGNAFPEKGFELVSTKDSFVTVKGKDWEAYKVTLKVVRQNNKWLVDDCGVINIPKEKRATR